MRRRKHFSGVALRAGAPVVAWLVAGCGSAGNDRFAARTDDEVASDLVATVVPAGDGGIVDGGSGAVDAGPAGDDGGPADGGGPTGLPSASWHFDDCSPKSPFLVDATGGGANAQQRLKAACVPGISGLGVDIRSAQDIIQVADEPQLTVQDRVAAAAWIKPRTTKGDRPIILKRLNNKTSFSLGVHDGQVEFSVVSTTGKTILSQAPIDANVWSHVGGFYDGHFLFLFVNGQQVGQVDVPGKARDVIAPIRIGATTGTQFFDGIIDEPWVSMNPVTGADIAALACIHNAATFTVSSQVGGPAQPDTTVLYSLAVTNNDRGFCQPDSYFLSLTQSSFFGDAGAGPVGFGDGGGAVPAGPPPTSFDAGIVLSDAGPPPFDAGPDASFPPPPPPPPPPPTGDGIQASANPSFIQNVQPGTVATFEISVSGTDDADPGTHTVPFSVFANQQTLSGSLLFDLAEPTGCHVTPSRELMIRDTSVVDDPVRTSFAAAGNPHAGVWTFGRLMRDMAPTPDQAPAFVQQLFSTWLTDQTVNGFSVAARPGIQQVLFDNWPRTATGALDLDQSPLRLLAIVDRVDVRDLTKGNAGEGRFVFGVLGPGNNPEQFTVILEYKLVAKTAADVLAWANAWHALQSHPFPSEEYNAALEALTLRFSGRGVAPGRPNGNALGQLRTNEIALSDRWELRQFELSATTGALVEQPITLTPDLGFNGSAKLARFINANEASIVAETDTVPLQLEGAAFLGGSVFNDPVAWTAPGVNNNEARFHLSLNTCNGCHGAPETNTQFLQISPRFGGQSAVLSPFLTGTTVLDPVTGAPRTLNDLARRKTDLTGLVCPPPAPAAPAAVVGSPSANAAGPATPTTVAKGIGRVH